MTNIYFDSETLKKIDLMAKKLGISRSATVKVYVHIGFEHSSFGL